MSENAQRGGEEPATGAVPATRRLRDLGIGLALVLAGLVLLFASAVLWPEPSPVPPRASGTLLIENVGLVEIDAARVRPGTSVLVRDGRVVAVSPTGELEVPADAQRVDGTGRFLLPALWDMHVHVYAFAPLLDLPLWIAYGVTNVRDMQGCPRAGDPFIACAEDKRRWTAEAVAGTRVAPRIVSSTSFMANGPRMLERLRGVPGYFGTATEADGRAFVRHFAAEVEEIKVYDRVTREAWLGIVDEARARGLAVVGHRPYAVDAVEAAAHMKSLEHARFLLHESFPGAPALRAQAHAREWREDRRRMLDEHDPARAAEILAAMAHHGTWYVPTHLTRWSDAFADDAAVRDDPVLVYLHPLMRWQWLEDVNALLASDPSPEARATYREFWRKGLELTGAAHRAGVRVLAGTDYLGAGTDLHRELEQLVLAGLAPAAALRAATLAPAEYYGLGSEWGEIAPGRIADLLLLDADPLVDVRNTRSIRAVVFAGRLYDRASLDAIDAHVRRQARSISVGAKILWRFVRQPASY